MGDEREKKLELRIEELENQLKELRASRRELQEISSEDLRAYNRVREQLRADWGEFCGINDCMVCVVCSFCGGCVVCTVCMVCDVECSCGPCSFDVLRERSSRRFRSLGR